MEARLRRADASGSKLRVVLSRRRYLAFVTRVERLMARRFSPDLMLLTRCAWVDPAVYARFYLPRLCRAVGLERRLGLAAWLARVPPRQLYLHLDTPVEVAMARIQARLESLNAGAESGREHWLHMHEQTEVLKDLSRGMTRALELVTRRTGARVVRIDNTSLRQDGVVELMADQVLTLMGGGRTRRRREDAEGKLGPLEVGGRRRVVLIASGSGGGSGGGSLQYLLSQPPSLEEFKGPYPLDRSPIQSMAQVSGLPPEQDKARDVWVVYCARGEQGGEVRMARLDGHGQEARWDSDLESPGLLSTSTLVRGAIPAAAWGVTPAGEERCLVAYAEPSRTQLWGLSFDRQARIAREPFVIASAEEDLLLSGGNGKGQIKVAFQADTGQFVVTWASYKVGSREPCLEQREEVPV